ncbi:SDR family oxidoreductase [Metabacillus sp. RGM 3146]|uniref:SDR family oxidoreductase n=1 Tax=Metabacillus sp. RGM 3146 TaxID=3401092 RepID=UPI003B9B72E5
MKAYQIDLSGKVAVVTGGAGVLCAEFSKALASCGASVAILNRTESKAEALAEEITSSGGMALGIDADVLKKESLEHARQIIQNKFGGCDILINGAGGNHPSGTTSKEYFELDDLNQTELTSFFDLDEEGIRYVFDINFMGTLLATQVFAKDMVKKQGCSIINISSMNAFTPLTKIPSYSAAKASVSNFTQWLAVHFSKAGVRVNAIAPGFFLTDQNRNLLVDKNEELTERAAKIISQTPMSRFGEKEELVGTLLYLSDPRASGFVTGIVIPVDGGFSAYSGV